MADTIQKKFAVTVGQTSDVTACCAIIGAHNAKAIDREIVAAAVNDRNPDQPPISATECRYVILIAS